jgi:hypothetical protein
MASFRKSEPVVDHHQGKILSKEEFDAKHEAALEAKAIISWKSPERVFKARSSRYFVKVGLYGLVFILAAIAFGEYFLVGVILAVMFMVYVLATHPPQTLEHKITNMGITSGGRPFLWEELEAFWFDKKGDDRLLVVDTKLHFPGHLIILLTTVSERTLLDLLEKHLHYHPAPVRNILDKWAAVLQQKINFE